jgi:hypothetical protein
LDVQSGLILEHGKAHAFFAVTWTDLFSGKTGWVAAAFHCPNLLSLGHKKARKEVV